MQLKYIYFFILLFYIFPSYADSVREFTLKNGLKLIVKEDHRSPVFIFQIWYKVGGGYEPDGITGISHALEHMMFQGSLTFPDNKFSQKVSENGGIQNAFTDQDFTAYYQELSKEKLPLSFELEADRMKNLLLRQENFTKEIQVVMEERRMRTDDNSTELLNEQLNATAFITSPYRQPVVGWQRDLKNLKIADVRKWYQQWYTPNNAIIVVVGDVNPEQVYHLAQKFFEIIPAKEIPYLKPQNEVKGHGEKEIHVRVAANLPSLIIAYHVPVIKSDLNSADPYALALIATLLAQGDSSQLTKNLVRGKQLLATVDSEYNPFNRLDSLFIIRATPSVKIPTIIAAKAIRKEISDLQTHLISARELKIAKTKITVSRIYQKDMIFQQAYELGSLAAVDLDWRLADIFIQKINSITPEYIQKVARQYLTTTNATTAFLDPIIPLINTAKSKVKDNI